MTQEEKNLLLQDLCARLPYGVKAQVSNIIEGESKPFIVSKELTFTDVEAFVDCDVVCDIKPYLRPMSSMTESEIEELSKLCSGIVWKKDILRDEVLDIYYRHDALDWLLKHHFDTRGLIPMGLALIAPEGMYNF